jgi:hypothetical protein
MPLLVVVRALLIENVLSVAVVVFELFRSRCFIVVSAMQGVEMKPVCFPVGAPIIQQALPVFGTELTIVGASIPCRGF